MNDAAIEKTSQHYIKEFIQMEEEVEDLGVSEVTNFYEGCNVFVTGGSGFLGKLLIEKLLRCTNLNKIYIMMRPKKGKTTKERFDEQFEEVIYDNLKREKPNFAKKLVIINGETGAPDLGISPEDLKELKENVHVIFHGAANVRFDEKLRTVTEINVRGTKLLLQLAKEMKHFKAFVHISTAFSHCTYKFIEEKFYKPPIDANKILDLLEILDDGALESVSPSIVGEFPNTYAFSKAIAEDVVQKYGKRIPTCVVRPSIVIATYNEPAAGWINNLYGPTGVIVGAAVGIMRTLHCCKNKVADIIPADYVINNLIVAAWDTATTWQEKQKLTGWETLSLPQEQESDPVIYNCVSSCQNPVTWDTYMHYNIIHGLDLPSKKTIWYFYFILVSTLWKYNLSVFILHTVPGFFIDLIAMMLGRKPILLKTYAKIHKFSNVIAYFCTQQWKFTNNEVVRLWEKLSPIDKQKYDFLVSNYEWGSYFRRHVFGLRLYLVKDPITVESIESGRIHYHRLKVLHYSCVTMFFVGLAFLSGYIIYILVSSVVSFFVFLWNRY